MNQWQPNSGYWPLQVNNAFSEPEAGSLGRQDWGAIGEGSPSLVHETEKKAEIARDLFSSELLPADFSSQWQPTDPDIMFDGLDMLNGVQEGIFGKDPFLIKIERTLKLFL